jgi:hypothetical protein
VKPHYLSAEDLEYAQKAQRGYAEIYGPSAPLTGRLVEAGQRAWESSPTTLAEGAQYITEGMRGGGALMPGPGFIAGQIRPVYHGSPHRFDKFKNEAIGTGEGAQAFGYGHYLTEEPGVAKTYAKNIKDEKVIEEFNKRLSFLAKEMDKYRVSGNYRKFNSIEGEKAAEEYDYLLNNRTKLLQSEGNIYEATLHKGKKPGEYEYLRWDEPLPDKQKEKIIGLLRNSDEGGPYRTGLLQDLTGYENRRKDLKTGENWYKELSVIFGSKRASEMLKSVGIDGIKYPTGTLSGVKGGGKFNYVVFDPEDIAIEKIGGKLVQPPTVPGLTPTQKLQSRVAVKDLKTGEVFTGPTHADIVTEHGLTPGQGGTEWSPGYEVAGKFYKGEKETLKAMGKLK